MLSDFHQILLSQQNALKDSEEKNYKDGYRLIPFSILLLWTTNLVYNLCYENRLRDPPIWCWYGRGGRIGRVVTACCVTASRCLSEQKTSMVRRVHTIGRNQQGIEALNFNQKGGNLCIQWFPELKKEHEQTQGFPQYQSAQLVGRCPWFLIYPIDILHDGNGDRSISRFLTTIGTIEYTESQCRLNRK